MKIFHFRQRLLDSWLRKALWFCGKTASFLKIPAIKNQPKSLMKSDFKMFRIILMRSSTSVLSVSASLSVAWVMRSGDWKARIASGHNRVSERWRSPYRAYWCKVALPLMSLVIMATQKKGSGAWASKTGRPRGVWMLLEPCCLNDLCHYSSNSITLWVIWPGLLSLTSSTTTS